MILMVTVKRALLSCFDKTGLEAFARALASWGVELIASGGTAECLRAHGLRVTTVEQFTGIREQLDGRVKTLHPKIYAGILARRDDPAHLAAVGPAGMIDLVVVTLYPFARTMQQPGVTLPAVIEQIDVGGVSLLRAAAKNFAHVAAVCRPDQYPPLIEALTRGKGTLPEPLARQLAATAFQVTCAYDARNAEFLVEEAGSSGASQAGGTLPSEASVSVRLRQTLRYGENPHQRGAWYLPAAGEPWGLGTLRQLQGKELSYNNLLDMDAALRCLVEFEEPTCAIIKHHSLCGLASAETPMEAYAQALACDAESAFGGMVGCNTPVEAALASQMTQTFLEGLLAPSVATEALAIFHQKPSLRVVTVDWPSVMPAEPEWRQLSGGWLRQDPDRLAAPESWRVVTTRAPTDAERRALLVAWKTVKHAMSNAVVLSGGHATVAIGQGQPSRVGAVRLAIQKAGERLRSSSRTPIVAASDGFFPFPDSIELLAGAGVRAVIQPGGSIRDAEVITAADRAGLAMVCTGIRHFRH